MAGKQYDTRGIEVREGKAGSTIRIKFMYLGAERRETLRLEPTKANLKFAQRKRGEILNAIALGTFNYAEHFPNSPTLEKLGISGGKTVTIGSLMDDQLKAAEKNLSPSTHRGYMKSYNAHLKAKWGKVLVNAVKPSTLATWISDNFTCKVKTIRNHLTILHSAFNQAVHDDLIPYNPLERVDIDRCASQEQKGSDFTPEPYTMQEITTLLAACRPEEQAIWRFAFATGMRTSEVIGLHWDDVDFNSMKIHVRRARVVGVLKDYPKTDAGKRAIEIRQAALEALKEQKARTFLAGGYVFRDERTGQPWADDAALNKRWVRISKLAGVAYRNPYQTRHTFASTLLSAGQPPLYVAKQMGHKGTEMINKHYGRWIEQGSDPDTQTQLHDFFARVSPKGMENKNSSLQINSL